MVDYFLQGGSFMWPILIALIFGLGFVLERAYSLMLSGIDSTKFFNEITEKINAGDTDGAIQICNEEKGTRRFNFSCWAIKKCIEVLTM